MLNNTIYSFNDFITQNKLKTRIYNFITECKKKGVFINLLLFGPKYSGKKALVNCILNEYYGKDIHRLDNIIYDHKIGTSVLTVNISKSKYHFVIDPSKYMNYDKQILLDFIKRFLSTKNLINNNFYVCVILNINLLSKGAQNALKRIIEKYCDTCRFIFVSDKLGLVNKELLSRFVPLQCRIPNQEDMDILNKHYGKKIELNRGNIQRTMLELTDITLDKKSILYIFPETIHKNIVAQKFKHIYTIRDHIYTILNYNIDNTNIIKECFNYFNTKLNNVENKKKLLENACYYQKNMLNGNKQIIHLEGFIISYIALLHKESSAK